MLCHSPEMSDSDLTLAPADIEAKFEYSDEEYDRMVLTPECELKHKQPSKQARSQNKDFGRLIGTFESLAVAVHHAENYADGAFEPGKQPDFRLLRRTALHPKPSKRTEP